MDPLTILAAVGTTLKVVKEICAGLQWMQRVYEQITRGDRILRSIQLECNIYGDSIKSIGEWLKKNKEATGLKRQMRTTHHAITLVQCSMANLLLDLKKVQESGEKLSVKDKNMPKDKLNVKLFQQFIVNGTKQQWFQETMRIHLAELRAHSSTLQLTLGVIELTRHHHAKDKATEKLEVQKEKAEEKTGGKTEDVEEGKAEKLEESTKKLEDDKAQKANDNLIDLSDNPHPVLDQASPTTVESHLDLLDSSSSMALQEIGPSVLLQTEPEAPAVDQDLKLSPKQAASPDLNTGQSQDEHGLQSDQNLLDSASPMALQPIDRSLLSSDNSGQLELLSDQLGGPDLAMPPKLSVVNLLDDIDPIVTQAGPAQKHEDSDIMASLATLHQTNSLLDQFSETLACQESDMKETPAALHDLALQVSHIGDSLPELPKEMNVTSASPMDLEQPDFPFHRSSTDISIETPTSTAPASIFSGASYLSSGTEWSLSGITEEDIKGRNPLSQNVSKRPLYTASYSSPSMIKRPLDFAGTQMSKVSAEGNDCELHRSMSTTSAPTIYEGSELPLEPQEIKSEDAVSQSSQTQPLVPNIDEPDEEGFPWILLEARDGDEEMVQKLLVSGADVKVTHTTTGRHALSEASIHGHQRIVDLLIAEGCPIEHVDADGYTALHHACQKGHLPVAKSLILNKASIDAAGPQGQTALHLAIQVPHQNVVMLLLQHKADVNARDSSYRTPLHIGASQGNLAMCKYLLDEGAQLDSREVESKTALQLACQAGHYELVQMMLDRAKLNPTDMTFLAAFFAAVEYGHVRIAESFFRLGLKLKDLKTDSYKPATLAAKSGSLAMIDLMIKEECDIKANDEKSWNALHFASYHGHDLVIERLITHGVSTIATTSKKETPLLFAVKGGHFAVVDRLLRSDQSGSLINAQDEQGEQPVHHATRGGSLEIFNLLMSNGAMINVENCFGWQPLHIATAYGHLALVQRLLDQGANMDERLGSSSIKKDQTHKIVEDGYWAEARWPYSGSRPLHLACEYGHYPIASLFSSKGAKKESSCSEGWQPLHHAAFYGSSALVEMLLNSGVYPHATTNEGKTAQALQFCTTGTPISDEEKERIRQLLKESMDRVRKKKTFKGSMKRGSTVEEKNNLVRAVTYSMGVASRPHSHNVMSPLHSSHPHFTHSNSVPSFHRPPMAHHAHTTPAHSSQPHLTHSRPQTPTVSSHPTLTHSKSVSSSHSCSTPQLPVPSSEPQSPAPANATTPILAETNTPTSESPTAKNVTDQPPPSSSTDTPAPLPTPKPLELTVAASPKVKTKLVSTFGLNKMKPGMEMGKIGLGKTFEIGKHTLDLGKHTLELGKQGIEMGKHGIEMGQRGLELGKQGIEMGKQGIELGKQGLELGKQGLDLVQGFEMGKSIDIGRQGFDIGKQGYKKAKKFAKKGKMVTTGKSGFGLGITDAAAETATAETATAETATAETASSAKQPGADGKKASSSSSAAAGKKSAATPTASKPAAGKLGFGTRRRRNKLSDNDPNSVGGIIGNAVNVAVNEKVNSILGNDEDNNDDDDNDGDGDREDQDKDNDDEDNDDDGDGDDDDGAGSEFSLGGFGEFGNDIV